MRLFSLVILSFLLISCDTQKKSPPLEVELTDTTSAPKTPISIVSIYLVTEIMMPDGSMKDVKNLDMTVELQSKGRIMGYTGCNQFHGSYNYEDGVFSTSEVASTRKMCAENMDVENAFLQYISVPLNVEREDRGIKLKKQDATAMVLKKIDE